MSRFGSKSNRRLPLLLALLLFALQGAALAHESAHGPGYDARDCVVCSVGTQPAAPAPDTSVAGLDLPHPALGRTSKPSRPATQPPGLAEARAPPLHPFS